MEKKSNSKFSQFLELVLNTFTAKRVLIILIISIVFFAKENWVVVFINKFLKVPKEFSNILLDVILIGVSVGFIFWFAYLFLKRNYKTSYTQILSVIAILFLLFYFQSKADENEWRYHSLFDSGFLHIHLLIAPLLVFLFFHFRSFKYPFKKIEHQILPEHELVQDNPKTIGEPDLLGYSKVVDELHKILISQESKKSITIGLVGPWGNGKSTVIQMLVDRLAPAKTLEEMISNVFNKSLKDEYLLIHFLPYLNHQEDDLISEFFRELSSKLKPYNGKLSNLVLEYSKRLVDIYKNNVNLNFFDRHISSFEKTSAKEMYDDINNRLVETDKKILVFVDDLDRLNSKEILQVLKLIRNSADFTNVIFLVAMDKEYVTRLLLEQREILNSRFIDKFFQLEVYLPAIRKDNLRTIFKDLLTKRTTNFSEEFIKNIELAINDNRNLFDDHIKNIRDIKRAVNQIVYEYPYTQGAIDLKDFINFIYLKLKFPKYINILNDNRADILERKFNSDLVELKLIDPKGMAKTFGSHFRYYNYESLKKYSYFEILFPEAGSISTTASYYTFKERQLLLKTLAFLFGSENPRENTKSIKKVNNFKMLMEQRVFEEHILDGEFTNLMKLNSKSLKTEIKNLFSKKKLPQLLDRVEYAKPRTIVGFETIIEVLVFLYDGRREYNQYDSVLLKQLALQVDNYLKIKGVSKDEVIIVLKNKVFENENISLESRLFLLSELWVENRYNKLWELGEAYVLDKSLELYREYLRIQKLNKLWEFDDYTFYHIGNNLRKIEAIKDAVIEATVIFWSDNNIELLCAQSTEIEPWSMLSFKISDNVSEVFGSKNKFITFVKDHKDSQKPEIKEFISFFELFQRTKYGKMILYTFEVSEVMKLKVAKRKADPQFNREEYNDNKQLIFLSNVFELRDALILNKFEFSKENYSGVEIYEDSEEVTIYLMVYRDYSRDVIERFVDFLIKNIEVTTELEKIKYKSKDLWFNKNILPKESGYYLRLISEQPKK